MPPKKGAKKKAPTAKATRQKRKAIETENEPIEDASPRVQVLENGDAVKESAKKTSPPTKKARKSNNTTDISESGIQGHAEVEPVAPISLEAVEDNSEVLAVPESKEVDAQVNPPDDRESKVELTELTEKRNGKGKQAKAEDWDVGNPGPVLYVQNLNEHVKKDEMRKIIYFLFSTHGTIINVRCMRTQKMRGQAHIVFDDVVDATYALRSLQGFEVMGKKMRISYAKTISRILTIP